MKSSQRPNLALVLSGGGARGAYEAGVLHYIRTMLPPEVSQKRRFDILCGSSVGAINICQLAATAHDLTYQGNNIYAVWKNLTQKNVYKRDTWSFAKLFTRTLFGITSNLFSRSPSDLHPYRKKHFKSLLNTAPLVPFLKSVIPWRQISLNIRNELIQAVSLTATNVLTGKIELFVEKHPSVKYSGHYIFHDVKLEYYHALASAALPVIFQTVQIHDQHYMDGGLRLNTPMSPAIQLGAEKVLVIGLNYRGERADVAGVGLPKPDSLMTHSQAPTLGMMLGKIMSSIFLDKLDYDIEQMHRINRIIEWGEGCFGKDFVDRVNEYVVAKGIHGDIADRGLKKLSAMSIFPSRDLCRVFSECVDDKDFFTKGLSRFERSLLKILDVDHLTSKDFLSFVMFIPEYLQRLLELGFEDARTHHDALIEFMSA